MLSRSGIRYLYRPEIDGLRGVAVLAIVGYDCGIPWMHGGFLGIDVFFVLSGYLNCRLIYDELQQGSFTLAGFYLDRLRRVMPVLSAVILFCLGSGYLVLSPWEAYRLGQSAVAASAFGSNFLYLVRGSFFSERAITQPLLMTWSLSMAMQFWFALPILLIMLKKRSRQSVFLVIAVLSSLSLLACVYGEFRQHVWNFYLPLTRAWELGAGALLALGWEERLQPQSPGPRSKESRVQEWRGVLGAFLLFTSLMYFRPEMRFPGFETLLPVSGSILLLSAPKSQTSRVLSSRLLVALGLISYPLYLWHWPLLSFAGICSARRLHPLTIVLLMTLALGASVVSFFTIQRRFRKRSESPTSRILLAYGVWMVILVALGGSFYVTRGLPSRTPTLYGVENRAAIYRHYPCISSGSYLRLSPQCAPPSRPNEPAMAVLGGGHAEAFAEGLRDHLHVNGWQLVTLTRESCPPTRGVSQWGTADSTLADSCRRFNRSALDYILSRPDIRAVVLVGRWRAGYVPDSYQGSPADQTINQNANNLRSGLAAEVDALEAAGKHVVVLEDTPEFPYDPVAGIRSQYLPFRRMLNRLLFSDQPQQGDGSSELRSVAVPAGEWFTNQQVLAVKAAHPKLLLVDPIQALCHADRCSFANGDDLFFFDSIHLSRTGAMQILPLFPDLKSLR